MPRREEFLSNMRDALMAQDAEWDITPGTPEYKILEAVAQQLEGVSRDGLISTYHFDIDKKSGIELDLFLSLWGFYRIKAQRATGQVTFRRATVATTDVSIPVGTQVFMPSVNNSPTIYFSTAAGAVISAGTTEVTVPVEAATGGTIGNINSYKVTGFGTNIAGVTEVYNSSPMTGGSNAESDDAFRERFRRTFMRNVSGTENQYSAVAYQESAFVNRVNSISAVERYTEQIQLALPYDLTTETPYVATKGSAISGGTITLSQAQANNLPDGNFYVAAFSLDSVEVNKVHKLTRKSTTTFEAVPALNGVDDIRTLKVVFPTSAQDSKYVYPAGGETVGVGIGTASEILAKSGGESPDYTIFTLDNDWTKVEDAGCSLPLFFFSDSGVTRLGGPGTIVDVSYEYTPQSSRNNPDSGIVNKLDVYVDGVDELNIQEEIKMPQTPSNIFDSLSEESLDPVGPRSDDFIREDGVTHPQSGHLFTMLGRSPVMDLGAEFTVQRFISGQNAGDYKYNLPNATTYYRDQDYWLVKKTTDADALENNRGSQRAIEGIEWKTPIRLADGEGSETYIFPRKGANESSPEDLEAPFEVVATDDGNLTGYYAYVVTWEVDGKESLPSAARPTTELDNEQVLVRFNDFHSRYPGIYIDAEAAGKTIYRKFYRSKVAASADAAESGPFYLVNIVRNNSENAWWIDNKSDDDLGLTEPPKVPPPHAAPLSLTYSYNALIERLDLQLESVRLVGQDVLSHQAELIPIKFNLAVVLLPNTSVVSARNSIQDAIESFLNRKQFSGDLQLADLFAIIESVPEVDNVRLLTESEKANEVQKLELSKDTSSFLSSDVITFTVDGYSTSSLSADETSYSVREALEALPSINEGDTYAAPLTNTLVLAPSAETELVVQGNANALAIHDLMESGSDFPVYLQITQFGDANIEKDEIVKVTDSEVLGDTAQTFKLDVTFKEATSGTATLTTSTLHGLTAGDVITVSGVGSPFNTGGTVSVTAVTASTLTYLTGGTETVAKVAASGTVTAQIDAEYLTAIITKKELADNVATLTTNSIHRLQPGDYITVDIDDARFDFASPEKVRITAISPTTISYVVDSDDTVTETAVTPNGSVSTADKVSQNIFTSAITYSEITEEVDELNSTYKLATLTTKFMHGFQPGDLITIYDVGVAFDSDTPIEVAAVGSFTVSYVVDSGATVVGKTAVTPNGSISTRIRQKNIKFTVERGQLGSTKQNYGSDVTQAETAAWIHVLGDVAVAKSRQTVANKVGVTYIFTFLPNALYVVDNWGNRSLLDISGNARFTVETSGDFTSSGLEIKSPGRGYGLEVLANNRQTVLRRYSEDMYFVSSELPVLGGLNISVRARNTF